MADLDAVRAWMDGATVVILGHSFGGLLAMEYAIRFPGRVSDLVLLNTAPASHAGARAPRAELVARTSPEQAARMAAIAADPEYQRGDIALEAERYRLRFGRTVGDPAVLEDVVGRLRRSFAPASIVAARAIEDRLYAETWDRPDYDLLPALRRLAMPTLVEAARRGRMVGHDGPFQWPRGSTALTRRRTIRDAVTKVSAARHRVTFATVPASSALSPGFALGRA